MRALGAIVLAAGASERFGVANKLLVSIDGNPLIRRVVVEIIGSGVAEVVVVTGWDSARISATLEDLTVRRVHNENWQSGMGTSIAAGVAALSSDMDGTFIVLGDMPRVTSILFNHLAAVFNESGRQAVVYPMTAWGDQRNPVLWPRRYFSRLTKLSGRDGAKKLLHAECIKRVAIPIDDTACLEDIDTPEDLRRMQPFFRNPRQSKD